jgi:hypothetical protein
MSDSSSFDRIQAAAAAKAAKKQESVATKYLKKNLTEKLVGPSLDIYEYDALKTNLGSDSGIAAFAASKGIRLDPAITNPKPEKESVEGDPAIIPGFKPSTAEGDNPAVFGYEQNLSLLNAQGNIDTQITKLNSDAAKYMARANHSSAVLGNLVSSFNF